MSLRLTGHCVRLGKACNRFTAVGSKAAARAQGGAARARADRLARFAGAAFASLRLPSLRRARGLSPNSLRSLRSLRSNRRRQVRSRLALRARPRALRRSALQRRAQACPHAPLLQRSCPSDEKPQRCLSGRRHPVRANSGANEERRAEVGARSAHQYPTCRSCLNAANEVSAVSSAARPRSEHRSAVQSVRSADRHSMSPRRVAPAATRRPCQAMCQQGSKSTLLQD